MKIIKALIFSTFIFMSSYAFAQMEVEVGGKVEAQIGFRGNDATYPFLVPSSVKPLITDPLLRSEGAKFDAGVRAAIVTDSLIDIWATGKFNCECLCDTTYGAKIELFADPTSNKYSVDAWRFNLPGNIIDFPGSLGFIPAFVVESEDTFIAPFTPIGVLNPGPAREVKIFLENKCGKFEIGDTIGASKHLQVDAATIAVGNGGIAGDSRLWATSLQLLGMFASADMITNKVAFYYVDTFFGPLPVTITTFAGDALLVATFNGIGTEMRYSGKASYYTPRYAGFVAGISYIPDTDIYGSVSQLSNVSRHHSPFAMAFKDVVEGGINYDCKIQDVGVKAAIVGEVGKSKRKTITTFDYYPDGGLVSANILGGLPLFLSKETKDLRSYEFGLEFDYCGFGLAGSYGVNRPLIEGLRDNRYWTIGAAYTYCDFGISINYMDNRQKSKGLTQLQQLPSVSDQPLRGSFTELKYRNFVVDVEYRICDGFIPYASFANINVHQPFNANLESKFNQGIGLIGLKVLF